MKKVLFVFVAALLFVAGCSGGKEESAAPKNEQIKEFTQKFNDIGYDYPNVGELKEESFGEIKEEKYEKWQTLYDEHGAYSIDAKYNFNDELTGFSIVIDKEQIYYRFMGSGIDAAKTMVEVLGLDKDKFEENCVEAINMNSTEGKEYKDNGYNIFIYDFNVDGSIEHGGLTINIDKDL